MIHDIFFTERIWSNRPQVI